MTPTEEKLFRLEASHTSLCVRVAMLEMVLREVVELLASTHPEERWIMQHLSMLPVNNKGTGVHDERD